MIEVDAINQIAINLMPGELKEYLSFDSMLREANQTVYTTEF